MSFRYTVKVGYSLLVIALFTPFSIMIQLITVDDFTISFLAPMWQYIFHSSYPTHFAISPFGLLFIPYYGLSVYVAWLAYNTARKQDIERKQYAWRVCVVIALQIAVIMLIPPFSGSPQPLVLPLPIVGAIALLLTNYTVRKLISPWEDQTSWSESEEIHA